MVTRALKRGGPGRRAKSAAAMVAEAVQKARKRAKLTQVELAERIGTYQRTISRIESGQNAASIATLEHVAKATGSLLDVRLRPRPKAR